MKPRSGLRIGGSYIGLEFAQIFRRFGANVTVLGAAPQIMFREDKDVAKRTQAILEEEGIRFEVGVKIQEAKTLAEGLEVAFEKNGQLQHIKGSHLSLAVGRVPNSDRLNLSAAGIEMDARGQYLLNIPALHAFE